MPHGRCIICNHCPEIDGSDIEVEWSKREKGYVCANCDSAIIQDIIESPDMEQLVFLEGLDMDYYPEGTVPDEDS